MNIRDFLQSLNEEEIKKTEQEEQSFAPAAATLQPGGDAAAATGEVESPEAQATDEVVQAEQPTDGETPAPEAQEIPSEAPVTPETSAVDAPEAQAAQTATEEPEGSDEETEEDDTKKRPTQAEYNAQTSLPEESIQEATGVTDYNPPSQGGTRKELLDKFKETKDHTYAEAARKAGATQDELKQAMNEEESFEDQFAKSLSEGVSFKVATDSIKALVESQGIEGEYSEKAVQIFESAVQEVAKAHVEKVSKYAAYVMEQLVEQKLQEMEDVLDDRLTESVAQWHSDNQIGIEQGIRVQVAESMMEKLSGVLKEHFVEVPDFKKDLYEENLKVVSAQGLKLTEEVEKSKALTEEVASLKKQLFIESNMQGMTMLQREKVKELASGLVYESEEDFAKKFDIIKESLVEKKAAIDSTAILEDSIVIEEEIKQPKRITDPYVDALSNSIGKYKGK